MTALYQRQVKHVHHHKTLLTSSCTTGHKVIYHVVLCIALIYTFPS